MFPTVTSSFIQGVIRNGRLTEARLRFEAGTATPSDWKLDAASCWSLVCEEVVDTEHEPEGYDAVYAELNRRGFSGGEIDEMRRLAWETAGWLNYDMMLLDWNHLDEADMREALDLMLERKLIGRKSYQRDFEVIQRFLDRDPPSRHRPIEEAPGG